eukprot:547562-Amphidinium_carterae.1
MRTEATMTEAKSRTREWPAPHSAWHCNGGCVAVQGYPCGLSYCDTMGQPARTLNLGFMSNPLCNCVVRFH